MQNSAFFENMQERISKLLDETPVADLRKNLRAVLQQGFEHFDLATREQLDLQTDLLARAQDKIADLEMRVNALEGTAPRPSTMQDPPLG